MGDGVPNVGARLAAVIPELGVVGREEVFVAGTAVEQDQHDGVVRLGRIAQAQPPTMEPGLTITRVAATGVQVAQLPSLRIHVSPVTVIDRPERPLSPVSPKGPEVRVERRHRERPAHRIARPAVEAPLEAVAVDANKGAIGEEREDSHRVSRVRAKGPRADDRLVRWAASARD